MFVVVNSLPSCWDQLAEELATWIDLMNYFLLSNDEINNDCI